MNNIFPVNATGIGDPRTGDLFQNRSANFNLKTFLQPTTSFPMNTNPHLAAYRGTELLDNQAPRWTNCSLPVRVSKTWVRSRGVTSISRDGIVFYHFHSGQSVEFLSDSIAFMVHSKCDVYLNDFPRNEIDGSITYPN